VSWRARKQRTVALSSTESELVAASLACQELIFMRQLLEEFNINTTAQGLNASTLYIDNQAVIAVVKNANFSHKLRHVDTRHKYLNECVAESILDPVWVPTDQNCADLFTKSLPRQQFIYLRKLIGME